MNFSWSVRLLKIERNALLLTLEIGLDEFLYQG